ncbi:MAG: response regulator [Neoaquamicrobium sediminum]|uniref:response regulator n=1 Tax=Neoaquamicrobium sediminum TaxID=1849104 RepID=UPI004037FE26
MSAQEMVALLVEDEPLTAMLAAGILRDIGYVVFEARTMGEADKLLLQGSRFNLLFTDIELADGSSGVELAFKVAESQPDIHIIVTSGRQRPAILPDKADFMAKPYTDRNLREMAMRSR